MTGPVCRSQLPRKFVASERKWPRGPTALASEETVLCGQTSAELPVEGSPLKNFEASSLLEKMVVIMRLSPLFSLIDREEKQYQPRILDIRLIAYYSSWQLCSSART